MEATPNQPNTVTQPTKRCWWQFSLKTMFVWVTVVGVLLALLGMFWIAPARRQRAAVKHIRELRGSCLYFDSSSDESWLTSQLRDWLPQDYFDEVELVSFNWRPVTDDDLAVLSSLYKTETLFLASTRVTNSGLEHISSLTELRMLDLYGTRVTDAGLVQLKSLKQLKYINLEKTQVTSIGLAHLSGLTQLQTLDLSYTQVSDNGVVHLQNLPHLETLRLEKTQITSTGILALRQALPNCWITYSRSKQGTVGTKPSALRHVIRGLTPHGRRRLWPQHGLDE